MREVQLEFQGYTWEDYFYVISNRSGILVAYKGGLDREGAVILDEVIYVDEADKLSVIYESESFLEARIKIGKDERVFFSYAEICDEGREEMTQILKTYLMPTLRTKREQASIKLNCKGACALFPEEVLKAI